MACYRCWRGELAMAGTKFSLLGFYAQRAVQNSPCSASMLSERYKTLPADAFWAKTAVFSRAGRVLYRDGCATAVVGRVLYRCGRLVMPLVSQL